MWISNTASVILLLPVALSVIAAFERQNADDAACRRFALAMLLGLAYAASIGGLGTLIGTAPNALLAGFLRQQHGIELSFAAWSAVTLPLIVVFLPAAWLVLTRLVFPLPAATDALSGVHVAAELGSHGAIGAAERRMAAIFAATAALWLFRPVLAGVPALDGLSDPGIAVMGALALFLVPSSSAAEPGPLLTWREAQALPWQVILLFGGGLSLAAAIESTGLANWIGQALAGLGHLPPLVFLTAVTATIIMMMELASNTATVAALLPVATPPNALVFATGHVAVADMLKAGLVMNLLAIVLVTLATLALTPLLPRAG
jgi:sodium-dependent dicarboxylate transporter 2/3/5